MKIFFDLFPLLLFFAAFKLYGIYAATAVAIVASFIQVAVYWLQHRRFEKMHLITLGVIVLFGGATLYLQDPLFIKWKPTVVNWLFAAAFLGSQFIGKKPFLERMMSHAVTVPAGIWFRLNLAWVTFFFAMGALNLYVVYNFDESTWVNFKVFGIIGLTLVFVLGQTLYLARHIEAEQTPEEEA